MKKIFLSLFGFIACLCHAKAQTLYATTFAGGSQNVGAIIKFTVPTGTAVAVHSFLDDGNGKQPFGTLLYASDKKLYGTTFLGGAYSNGTIFSFDPVTSSFTTLKDLDGYYGTTQFNSLIQATDGKIYGTSYGGAGGFGLIFSYNPATSTFTPLAEFNGANGSGPCTLMQASDGLLYGVTGAGGSVSVPFFPDGFGVLFSYDISTNTITKLVDFDGNNGVKPIGRLVQAANGKLYGMTPLGGTFGEGNIFSFDPVTNACSNVFSFNGNNGGVPQGNSLTLGSDNKLYGMTANNNIIFSFDPASLAFNTFRYFSDNNGLGPYGNLLQLGNGKFYGMTYYGGSFDNGTIFSFDPTTPVYNKLVDFNGTNGAAPEFENAFTEANECLTGTKYYRDADGDGFGNADSSIVLCTQPPGYVKNNLDCNDHYVAFPFWKNEVKMCHSGITECVRLKDIWKKLQAGWKVGPCSNPALPRSVTGIQQPLPTQYSVSNYPNPFAGSSTIRYELPTDSRVTIKLYDPSGRMLNTLVNDDKKAGRYSVNFNAGSLSAGAFYYKITAKSKGGQFEQTNKMIIIR